MPPTFLYLVAFTLWLCIAAVVWAAAAVLVIRRASRRTGLSLACAMAGTFPGVWAYQLLAAPVVLVWLLTLLAFWKAVEPGEATTTQDPVVVVASIMFAVIAMLFSANASLVGFVERWRAGWAVGRGARVREAIENVLLFRAGRWVGRSVRGRRA